MEFNNIYDGAMYLQKETWVKIDFELYFVCGYASCTYARWYTGFIRGIKIAIYC